MVNYEFKNRTEIFRLYGAEDKYGTNSLLMLSSYLLIDGLFTCYNIISQFNLLGLTTLIHHLIGSYGIYTIATYPAGFAVGVYFAMTEFSTPFLHLSWYFKINNYDENITTSIFLTFTLSFFTSRIFSIPYLIVFESMNHEELVELPSFYYYLFYYGIYTLITLNITWFLFIIRKLIPILKKEF